MKSKFNSDSVVKDAERYRNIHDFLTGGVIGSGILAFTLLFLLPETGPSFWHWLCGICFVFTISLQAWKLLRSSFVVTSTDNLIGKISGATEVLVPLKKIEFFYGPFGGSECRIFFENGQVETIMDLLPVQDAEPLENPRVKEYVAFRHRLTLVGAQGRCSLWNTHLTPATSSTALSLVQRTLNALASQ